jgi:hypothetical protein
MKEVIQKKKIKKIFLIFKLKNFQFFYNFSKKKKRCLKLEKFYLKNIKLI